MSEVAATVTLRTLTMGFGTQYRIDEPGISGLGQPPVKTADTQLDGRDGSFAAPDFKDVRAIIVPLILDGTSEDDCWTLAAALNDAWEPAEDGVDLELGLSLPVWGDLVLVGRARGVELDLTAIADGTALALCHFDALAPVFVTP